MKFIFRMNRYKDDDGGGKDEMNEKYRENNI